MKRLKCDHGKDQIVHVFSRSPDVLTLVFPVQTLLCVQLSHHVQPRWTVLHVHYHGSLAHQHGRAAVPWTPGVRWTQHHCVQHPGRTSGFCKWRQTLRSGPCVFDENTHTHTHTHERMWPLCSLRVLKWISPPPNWSLVLGSRSALCWTIWLRRRWSGQASPSGGTQTDGLLLRMLVDTQVERIV